MQKNTPNSLIHDPTEDLATGPIVGIDFGTSHSLVTIGSPPSVVSDALGPISLPTTVSYTDEGCIFGEELQSIHSVKRLLGQSFSDIKHLKLPHVSEGVDDTILIHTKERALTPEQIATDFFQHLYTRTASHLGTNLRAVITVPAYFSERARHIIRKCAMAAGWQPFKLLSEPTAAAFAYGLHKEDGCYLVYDWGGGTFDVSVLSVAHGAFQILALNGDMLLGGDDIDYALALKVLGHDNVSTDILYYAKSIKEALAIHSQAQWSLNGSCSLIAEDLAYVFEPFIQRTLSLCDEALHDASLEPQDIRGIILAGGTTIAPCVQSAVQKHLGAPLYQSIAPQSVVAFGSAIFAHNLQEGAEQALLDILPLSLGIEIKGGLTDTIIPRNTPIPYGATQRFTTSIDNQKTVVISVLQGERDLASHCVSLGTILVGPLPPLPAGVPQIEVSFLIDADGLLTVHVIEKISGVSSFSFLHDVLDAKEKERIIRESSAHALADADEVQRRSLLHTIQDLAHKVAKLQEQTPLDPSILQELKRLEARTESECSLHEIEQSLLCVEKSIIEALSTHTNT